MATIDDLNTSITQMNPTDLLSLIHKLRSSRRTKKVQKMTTRSVQRRKDKPTISMAGLTKRLSKETKLELIKMFEEELK